MTMVAIVPVRGRSGEVAFRAVAGDKQSQGKTAGEALDALTAQLPADESGALIIVQSPYPDSFFGAAQQQRLTALMDLWRAARDRDEALPPVEQAELDSLVEAELRAAGERAVALADEAKR
jgi:hypothetical protein